VIVHDLDIFGVALGPSEADAPLIIDPNAHLPCPTSLQSFEPISWWITQVVHGRRGIELTEFAKGSILYLARELTAGLSLPDFFGLFAFERSDHPALII
jgi:hypothetical protein